MRGLEHALALGPGHVLEPLAVTAAVTLLHLDGHRDARPLRDDVQLAGPAAEVARADAVATRGQELAGQVFARLARAGRPPQLLRGNRAPFGLSSIRTPCASSCWRSASARANSRWRRASWRPSKRACSSGDSRSSTGSSTANTSFMLSSCFRSSAALPRVSP